MASEMGSQRALSIGAPQSSGEEPLTMREKVLEACSISDLPRLQQLFQFLDITSSHPEIIHPYDYKLASLDPPPTWEMLDAAAFNEQTNILAYLLDTFPSAHISDFLIGTCADRCNIPLFSLLLAHGRSVLNHELEITATPLSMACWGSDPNFALFLLQEGADPNVAGFLALSTLSIALLNNR